MAEHIADGEPIFNAVCSGSDVCMVGEATVPFDSYQLLSSKKKYALTVTARGAPVLNVGSVIAGSQSNLGKGVMSGTSLGSGDCIITSGNPTVLVEGQCVAQNGSTVAMNNNNCPGIVCTWTDVVIPVQDHKLPCNNPPQSSPVLEHIQSLNDMIDQHGPDHWFGELNNWAAQQTDKLRPEPLKASHPGQTMGMSPPAMMGGYPGVPGTVGGQDMTVEQFNEMVAVDAGVVRGVLGTVRSLVIGLASLPGAAATMQAKAGLNALKLAENIRLGNVCEESLNQDIKDDWESMKNAPGDLWDAAKKKKNELMDEFEHASSGDKAEMISRGVSEAILFFAPFLKLGKVAEVGEAVNGATKAGDVVAAESTVAAEAGSQTSTTVSLREGPPGNGINTRNSNGTSKGDPVDVATGDWVHKFSVLSLPGSLPLALSRFYRSRSDGEGLFGKKWTDEWSCSLVIHGDDLHFIDNEGVVLYYPLPGNGIFRHARNSRQGQLLLTGDIKSELTIFDRRTQRTQVFTPAGEGKHLLSAIHDRHGNRIDFIRQDGLLVDIHHSDGYALSLTWQQQQLLSIDLVTPQRQRLVTCHYDENGMLAECDTFQFTHLWHEYTREGFMTQLRDTEKTCVHASYDALGRVISSSTAEGYYNDRFIYHDDERCTVYQDAEGGESRYWYNDDGLVVRSLDELGLESLTVWDNTQLISRADALGRATKYTYNDYGEVIQLTLPGGHVLHYEYNNAGQLTRLQINGGQTWQWEYDANGSVVALTDPQGRKQVFSHSEQGDLLAHILPGGATWRWSHDALHQVRETIAPDGGVTHTEQDFLGRLLNVKDPLGFTTQFRHSKTHAGPQGSVEQINRPDGVRELMRQNSEKLPESFTDGEGKTTRYEYGAFDLLTAVIRPDGERLECRYDRLTRLTEIINAEGEHYRLEYDKAGQLIAETDFTGRTLRYQYDAAGRCIRTSFPDGTHLNRRYNVTDQITDEEVTRGDSDRVLSSTTFRYDTLCRLVEAKNSDATVTYEYDDAGKIIAETMNGRRTEYGYDPERDFVTQRTTGGLTERFTRGRTGELKTWQLNDHAPLAFEHDLCGQEISRRSDAGFYQQLGYTPAGMLTQQKAGDHRAGSYERNKSVERQWLYDHAYNLTMITDSLRGMMFNTLTANDQISHATWTGSGTAPMCEERFTYDKNLNLTRRQTWVNEILDSETSQQQLHGRVVSRDHQGWRHSTFRINPETGKPEEGKFVKVVNVHGITWKYDINGRLVEKLVDKGGYRPLEWRYRWDARSQLTGLETPEGERWEYKYDPFGRRISKRCSNRDKPGMDFHWNGDQLTEEISVGADGKPDHENAIRWIYEPGNFTPLARYQNGEMHYAVTDITGRIQELLTEDGTIAWRGKQQLWGREDCINKDDAPVCRLRFPGQYEDDESGLCYNRFRYYDCDTAQYISADPIGLAGGVNPYGYVSNPLSYTDPLGLCKTDVQQLDPNDIRFSQSSVNGAADLTNSMKANGWKGDPIDVVRMSDGKLTTIDNTRVLAASRAGIKVEARIHNASEALPTELIERFTTKKGTPSTWEDAVGLRIGKQSGGYKNQYPNGSVITGSPE